MTNITEFRAMLGNIKDHMTLDVETLPTQTLERLKNQMNAYQRTTGHLSLDINRFLLRVVDVLIRRNNMRNLITRR